MAGDAMGSNNMPFQYSVGSQMGSSAANQPVGFISLSANDNWAAETPQRPALRTAIACRLRVRNTVMAISFPMASVDSVTFQLELRSNFSFSVSPTQSVTMSGCPLLDEEVRVTVPADVTKQLIRSASFVAASVWLVTISMPCPATKRRNW